MISCLFSRPPKIPQWPALTPKTALEQLSLSDEPLKPGEEAVAVISSFENGAFQRVPLRFEMDAGGGALSPAASLSSTETLTVHEGQTKGRPIVGFGGAFTDAAVKNLALASDPSAALEWLFSPRGMGYSLTRVHIGSCDFAERNYCYVSDPNDLECNTFRLAPEDLQRIAWLQQASQTRGEPVRILASPWTAPPWMKVGAGGPDGYVGGTLRREDAIYKAWAQYFAKFVSAYAAAGMPVWAVTPQNEPNALPGCLRQTWETMFWDEPDMVRFIGHFLGPALAEEHPKVLIVAHDDQRLDMPNFIKLLAMDPAALKYIGGVGFHWYQYPPKPYGTWSVVNSLWSLGNLHGVLPHESYHHIGEARRLLDRAGRQDALLVGTEMCAGFSEVLSPPKLGPSLCDWDRAEVYGEEILRSLSEGMLAWLDWNLALDEEGGPNWAGNVCDAPLIRVGNRGDLLVQPMCVAITHFSHFIVPGAMQLLVDRSDSKSPLWAIAYSGGGRVCVVLLHRSPSSRDVRLQVPGRGLLRLQVPPHSIATVCWPLAPQLAQ